ncbi:MAG: helix-turn-helix transcriptional regulator [Gammaproteobacteria bacterium]|nr:helix-turn-helix transcriptional regulator [Gammaproteobacteria bacterium]
MALARRRLFENELVCLTHVACRPSYWGCGEVEQPGKDLLVLPLNGVFAKHDGPRQHIIANSNHALLFGRTRSYRISHPACSGDDCLSLEFSQNALASVLADAVATEDLSAPSLATHALLSPAAVLGRSLLWRRLLGGTAEPLEIEETSVALLGAAVRTACRDEGKQKRARLSLTLTRRLRQIETVKEAISVQPDQHWTLADLARLANTSPYHLARVFRKEVGAPIHQYVVRTRLTQALEAVLDAGADLTAIAVERGFASHSHFTASFRAFFGVTPLALRRYKAGVGSWRRLLSPLLP